MDYLSTLNPEQRAAVEQTEGPVMIIAGAGSGKTRVITYRIAHLLQKGVQPFNILALTFTNKAARAMRERIYDIAGPDAKSIWMGTFHSVFAKILRIEADKIGYPSNFTIYDTDDSKSVVKSILKELQLDDKLYNPNFCFNRISSAKNNLISPEAYLTNEQIQADDNSAGRDRIGEIYASYAKRCFKAGAMDFDDLLYKTNILIRDNPEVLYKYQNKFKYLMVDEYQDTNYSQYLIVKKLAAIHENLCVVGDDAQSIYAFRGATIQNILNFEKDYPDLKIFKLEQNYRSTQNIVNSANSIIANNQNQLKKNSFSEKSPGEKVRVLKAYSDNEEGKIIAESIAEERSKNSLKYKSFLILYRTNAQSRSMEEGLRKLNVPYKIYGGLSFYQRKEIKDLLAYFRLAINRTDEEALKRIINYPPRGIGKTTTDKLIVLADSADKTQWEIIENANYYFEGKGTEKLLNFKTMIQSFGVMIKNSNAFDAATHIAKESGLLKDLYDDKSIEGLSRYSNLQELISGIKEFSEREDLEDKSLEQFLMDVALLTGDEKKENDNVDSVSLMTIHSAKGLEFKHVYVVGMEENLFPSQLSIGSRVDLEEERRLFYVAITRAEERLTLSYALQRYRWGMLTNCEPSRFLNEIDPKYLDIAFAAKKPTPANNPFFDDFGGGNSNASKPKISNKPVFTKNHIPTTDFAPDDTTFLKSGDKVEHQRFGFGMVTTIEQDGSEKKATIQFDSLGEKQLLLKFAKLRIVR